jgi:hypothetical protein
MAEFNFREGGRESLRQIIQIFASIGLYNVATICIISIDFISYNYKIIICSRWFSFFIRIRN